MFVGFFFFLLFNFILWNCVIRFVNNFLSFFVIFKNKRKKSENFLFLYYKVFGVTDSTSVTDINSNEKIIYKIKYKNCRIVSIKNNNFSRCKWRLEKPKIKRFLHKRFVYTNSSGWDITLTTSRQRLNFVESKYLPIIYINSGFFFFLIKLTRR